MSAADREFVKAVREEAREYGIKLVFSRGSFVKTDGMMAFGYFDEKKICVAKGHSRWVEVLAHEYSHFLQWIGGSKIYKRCDNSGAIIDSWLHGKKHNIRTVHRAFENIRAMERECEMITVEVIKEYGLNVDIERYKQEANCYIYIHHLMELHRKRLDNFKKDPITPYYIRKMPASFRAPSHTKIPKKVEAILERCV
jgi:hypothetical protein